ADGDRRAVGVELLEALGGGDDAGLIEPVLERLLEVEHGGVVGDLDLEGEGGGRAGDDRGVHGSSPSGVKAGSYHSYRFKVYINQRPTPFGPRNPHQVVLLRPPLLTPRLGPPRPRRIDHQLRHLLAILTVAQPPQRVDETDPIHLDSLTPRR